MALENDKFNSLSDLYKRVLPALETKTSELNRNGFKYIKSLDVWNYCVENKWKSKMDLRIYEIVDDILNLEDTVLENFVRNNIDYYRNLIDKDENI